MSIASEITRLQGCKSDIRTALVNKGITSASTHNMADFATDISNISAGGATITVTYDSSFYNKTMTCTNGTKTYTKTTTSSGSTTFNVNEEGTWTITCNGVSVTVAVVLSYSTQMIPTGSTVTPVNDIQIWLKCGGIFDKTYTTISQVLADTTTLLALISDSNAVDYMVRSTNFASSVCGNSTAMTYIGNNNYCADTLLADSTWCTAICNSTYFESVLKVKVPTMTSNTTPSGECSGVYTSTMQDFQPWCAFDGNDSTYVRSNDYHGNDFSVTYKFENPVRVLRAYVYANYPNYQITSYKIQASNNINSGWVDLTDAITNNYSGVSTVLNNPNSYLYYRVQVLSGYVNTTFLNTIQFYGR